MTKIGITKEGSMGFAKESTFYKKIVWGTPYNQFVFDSRKAYFNTPNCNFKCPPGKEFFCCRELGCKKNCGFYEWEEVSFFSKEERDKILSKWNNDTGFISGCSLPRELKSYICLSWRCRYSRERISGI